ncbi:MAG: 16S rRNA (cytosine(1402)-N(4))-methyltransferase RsmH [Planctomycetaceae bacterium]
MTRSSAVHVPVLLREVIAQLDLRAGLTVVDGTVGAGGHSREILPRIQPGGLLIGLDRDLFMLDHAAQRVSGAGVQLIPSSYRDLRTVLDQLGLSTVDRILLDLGLSSDQLADRTRGFGFDAGGQLDMRFDVSNGTSAADWLANASQDELVQVFETWGESPQARLLAAAIVRRRGSDPVTTAEALLQLIQEVCGVRNPAQLRSQAAPIFQALRIAVNDELNHLETFLNVTLPGCLSPGGRVGIITFHSTEDRLVKQVFRHDQGWETVTRKPIEPTPAEVRINPRSRSAKLRVAVRSTDFADRK